MSFHPAQFRELVIIPALKALNPTAPSVDAASELLMLTTATESNLGYYIHQVKGPAVGAFQMEPATHDDIWENWLRYHPEYSVPLRGLTLPVDQGHPPAQVMATNLLYAAAMCRIHYLRVPHPLPGAGDVQGLASYWKRWYNTVKGAGTVEGAVAKYNKYVRGV